ncbi:MAG: PH domain-containing protein [Promethearchaeota archaeon]
MKTLTNEEKNQYLDQLMAEYADLRNPTAEKRFFSNQTFRNEIKFEPNERILYLNYQSLKYVLTKAIIPVLILILFSLMSFGGIRVFTESLEENLEIGNLAPVFWVLGITLVVIVGFTLLKQYLVSKSYRYIITDRRIIVGYTFLQRWTRAVEFGNIVDIVIHQPFFARLFKAGNVLLITGANEGAYVGGVGGAKGMMMIRGFMNIQTPFRIKSLIKELMTLYSENRIEVPPLVTHPLPFPEIKHAKKIGLKPEENVFKVYYKKQSSSIIKGLIAWLVAPFYVLFSIGDIGFLLDLGPNFLKIVGIILVAGVIVIILLSKFHSRGFEFVITDRRIVMYKKFLSITCRDVIMGKITDVSTFQMAVGRVANFGMINIGTKGFEKLIKFRDLFHIQGVANVVTEKDDIRNMVLYFQRGQFYNPLMEMYDPEFLNI